MIDEPWAEPEAEDVVDPEPAPAAPFRAGVSRIDRLRQRFWATRVRLSLQLRRDHGDERARRRLR